MYSFFYFDYNQSLLVTSRFVGFAPVLLEEEMHTYLKG